jgi:hypothetical protein
LKSDYDNLITGFGFNQKLFTHITEPLDGVNTLQPLREGGMADNIVLRSSNINRIAAWSLFPYLHRKAFVLLLTFSSKYLIL